MTGFWHTLGGALDAECARRMRRASRIEEYAEPAPPSFAETPTAPPPTDTPAGEDASDGDTGDVEISNIPRGTQV